MAGMKRFVTYIYSYENGTKGSNVGFAKVEIRGEDCRLELHLRGVYAGQPGCTVYLFREDAGDFVGVKIGEMRFVGGRGDFAGAFKAAKIADSPFGMGEMEGIFLLCTDERIFVSRWREGGLLAVSRERFREWTLETPRAREEIKPQDIPAPQEVIRAAEEALTAEEAVLASGETMRATELPMRNVFPGQDWTTVWESLQRARPLCHPFGNKEAVCVQLELKDLRELPRKYWYLGNNSFLLHGFFNYRYLAVGKTAEGRWFIGVPGIYQRQERVMAAIFGFPEFMQAVSEDGLEIKMPATGEPINHFGCWFRYIEE